MAWWGALFIVGRSPWLIANDSNNAKKRERKRTKIDLKKIINFMRQQTSCELWVENERRHGNDCAQGTCWRYMESERRHKSISWLWWGSPLLARCFSSLFCSFTLIGHLIYCQNIFLANFALGILSQFFIFFCFISL